MDIELVVHKRAELEKRIMEYIRTEFSKFEKDTGLSPNNIEILKQEVAELGHSKPTTIFTNCKITVEV